MATIREQILEGQVLQLTLNARSPVWKRHNLDIAGSNAAYFFSSLLVIGFLVLDRFLPLGVAAGVPYASAVMVASRTTNTRFILVITVVSIVLTVVGFILSPDGGELWKVISNRILAVFVIAAVGMFTINQKKAADRDTRQAVLLEQASNRRAQLIRSAETRSEFLGQISHELRTPLTSLTTFAHILDEKSEIISRERVKAHSQVIKRSARRLEILVDDLLDASGSETGTFSLERVETNLPQIVIDAVNDFSAQARLLGHELSIFVDIPTDSRYHAFVDPGRLTQVITNLVSNASKYSRRGTDINVYCGLENSKYVVSIEDHGTGIEPEDIQIVFTPFYRVDNEFVRSVPGAGLGLTIAKSIVELHGGSMSIESKSNVGTTVVFDVPAIWNDRQAS